MNKADSGKAAFSGPGSACHLRTHVVVLYCTTHHSLQTWRNSSACLRWRPAVRPPSCTCHSHTWCLAGEGPAHDLSLYSERELERGRGRRAPLCFSCLMGLNLLTLFHSQAMQTSQMDYCVSKAFPTLTLRYSISSFSQFFFALAHGSKQSDWLTESAAAVSWDSNTTPFRVSNWKQLTQNASFMLQSLVILSGNWTSKRHQNEQWFSHVSLLSTWQSMPEITLLCSSILCWHWLSTVVNEYVSFL